MNKVADWLLYAENDLKTAKAALDEGITNTACFHTQQTVEKCLKAILLDKEQEVPRTHDLLFLLEKAQSYSPELSKFSENAKFLNQFYIPMRYPDAFPGSAAESLPNRQDSERAIELAGEILNFVKSTIRRK